MIRAGVECHIPSTIMPSVAGQSNKKKKIGRNKKSRTLEACRARAIVKAWGNLRKLSKYRQTGAFGR